MPNTLILQLHAHSDRSHDSVTSIQEYVSYLESVLEKDELAVLGVTDHDVLPITTKEALMLSTEKVVVVPGIEWDLYKSPKQTAKRLASRREIITLGDHDNLACYLEKVRISLNNHFEFSRKIKERELIGFLKENQHLNITIPHPSHLYIEFYNDKEIEKLHDKLKKLALKNNFFVEIESGADPFPRIFHDYDENYYVLGGSDAHRIDNYFETEALFSVDTRLECEQEVIKKWQGVVRGKKVNDYKEYLNFLFEYVKNNNYRIQITKQNRVSMFSFFHSVPLWFQRRYTKVNNRYKERKNKSASY